MSVTEYRLRNIEMKLGKRHSTTIVVASEHDGELYVDGKPWVKPPDWNEQGNLLIILTRSPYPNEMQA